MLLVGFVEISLSCLTPFVGLLVVVCFLLSSNLKFVSFFSQFPSDEVVTAAQHLYEMVSFYFDDLGKPLFVDVVTSLYNLLGEFYYLLFACFIL